MSSKLVGYRFSPTVQEVLHVIEVSKAPVELHNVDWDDQETRKTLETKSPTGTFPYLETEEGVLSQSKAIEIYLAEKYKPELLGEGDLQKAQVRQWMDFASFELGDCAQKIVYPIFGWKPFCKESADEANTKIKEFMKALDQKVKGKRYAFGDQLTLADISLFRHLKFFFQLVWPKKFRETVFPNVNDWFLRVLNTPETDKVYGKVLLCNNQPLRPFIPEKKETKSPILRGIHMTSMTFLYQRSINRRTFSRLTEEETRWREDSLHRNLLQKDILIRCAIRFLMPY